MSSAISADTLTQSTPPRRGGALRSFLRRLLLADAVARERFMLADLPPERLADLGLTRGEAAREARRAPWDLPDGRA